jgi:Flp pilus assembly protein TadD
LGCRDEAIAELEQISTDNQEHPDVLEVRWIILADAKQWEVALEVARKLVSRAPKRASGWLNQAYALRRSASGGLVQAWEALIPAAEKFPKEPTVFYNLSCYACQMDRLDDAREWLQRALKTGKKDKIKLMALEDADLKPLWEEIRGL